VAVPALPLSSSMTCPWHGCGVRGHPPIRVLSCQLFCSQFKRVAVAARWRRCGLLVLRYHAVQDLGSSMRHECMMAEACGRSSAGAQVSSLVQQILRLRKWMAGCGWLLLLAGMKPCSHPSRESPIPGSKVCASLSDLLQSLRACRTCERRTGTLTARDGLDAHVECAVPSPRRRPVPGALTAAIHFLNRNRTLTWTGCCRTDYRRCAGAFWVA
jgi:hypothetical protein